MTDLVRVVGWIDYPDRVEYVFDELYTGDFKEIADEILQKLKSTFRVVLVDIYTCDYARFYIRDEDAHKFVSISREKDKPFDDSCARDLVVRLSVYGRG